MKLYGLVGHPLSHSFSRQYFSDKFAREGRGDCRYENFPLADISLLPALVKEREDLRGLNVTIPYKEKVLPFLDEVDGEAREIGAVNTIRITASGDRRLLEGFNTDVWGFRESLVPHLNPGDTSALILGTGGASRAVAFVLRNLGITFLHVSRTPSGRDTLGYGELDREVLGSVRLIINTSPLGMYPNADTCPDIPYHLVDSRHLLYDLVYNPTETRFLRKGREKGARTVGGLAMLHLQAEKSWEIWNT